MTPVVRTVVAEGSTIMEAANKGGEALQGLLDSLSIQTEAIVALSAQTVQNPSSGRWFHVMTLVVSADDFE